MYSEENVKERRTPANQEKILLQLMKKKTRTRHQIWKNSKRKKVSSKSQSHKKKPNNKKKLFGFCLQNLKLKSEIGQVLSKHHKLQRDYEDLKKRNHSFASQWREIEETKDEMDKLRKECDKLRQLNIKYQEDMISKWDILIGKKIYINYFRSEQNF